MEPLEDSLEDNKELLTSIPDPYTLSNTTPGETAELDQIQINQFLNTLAEIALNVASRKISHEQDGKQSTSL